MTESIPPNRKCAICGRVFMCARYDSDGRPEWIDIASHADRVDPSVLPHECPTLTKPPEES